MLMGTVREVICLGHIFCHFSFRKPKGSNKAIFCVMFTSDYEGKNELIKYIRAYKVWEDRQFINAIQSYSVALHWIWREQQRMLDSGIGHVYLVSGNSTLLNWLNKLPKQENYTKYIIKARSDYMVGQRKELEVSIGTCIPLDKEVAYKYCKDKYLPLRNTRNHGIVVDRLKPLVDTGQVDTLIVCKEE